MKKHNQSKLVGSAGGCSEICVNEFTELSAQKFREMLLKHNKRDPISPIIIYIDSYGGLVDALAKMIETMDEVTNPLVTVCIGKAMSCGSTLLAHGDIRYCGRHSRILIHELSGGAIGNVVDIQVDAAELKRLNRYFLGLLAKDCGIKGGYEGLTRIFKKQGVREINLNSTNAVQFGIVDKIGLPKLTSYSVHELLDIPKTPTRLLPANFKRSSQTPVKKKKAKKGKK